MISIVHTLTALRCELLVDVIPQLVGFICRQLARLEIDRVVPLGRLLAALSQNRRNRRPVRHKSLVKALGKHAPAVLVAYVRAWGDPRNEIPVTQRRFLHASIYSWCDISVRASHRGREGEGVGQPFAPTHHHGSMPPHALLQNSHRPDFAYGPPPGMLPPPPHVDPHQRPPTRQQDLLATLYGGLPQ